MLIQLKVLLTSTRDQSHSEYDAHPRFSWLFIVQGWKKWIYSSYCTVDLAGVCEIEDWSLIVKAEFVNLIIQLVPNEDT